jgi:hypothetical protein
MLPRQAAVLNATTTTTAIPVAPKNARQKKGPKRLKKKQSQAPRPQPKSVEDLDRDMEAYQMHR